MDGLNDALAEAIEAPATPTADAPSSAPPSARETIEGAVAAQKERAAAPDAPAKPSAPAASGVNRSSDGKFAPGTDRPAPDRTAAPGAPAVAPQTVPGAEPNAPADTAIRPPPGWSPQSKVDFDKLPEHIKADIIKREAEVNKGFEKLSQYKPVEKYFDMAAKGGTTLDKALEQYVGIEQLLRKDVFAGVERILANVGIKDPRQFVNAYQAKLAGGHQPAPQLSPQNPAHQAVDPRQIAAQVRAELQHEQALTAAQAEVQRFVADPKNLYYDNVKPTMEWLVQQGRVHSMQDAYDMACRMDPEIAKLISQPTPQNPAAVKAAAAATQARAAAKAVTGAPSRGNPAPPGLDPNLSRRGVIEAAVAAQKGRV